MIIAVIGTHLDENVSETYTWLTEMRRTSCDFQYDKCQTQEHPRHRQEEWLAPEGRPQSILIDSRVIIYL